MRLDKLLTVREEALTKEIERLEKKLADASARVRELESIGRAREAEVQAHMEARFNAEERAREAERLLLVHTSGSVKWQAAAMEESARADRAEAAQFAADVRLVKIAESMRPVLAGFPRFPDEPPGCLGIAGDAIKVTVGQVRRARLALAPPASGEVTE